MSIYGYARISTNKQSIERQTRNILREYPDAILVEEAYTGTTENRPAWLRLKKKAAAGDTIVFDSVSRMSRNAESGYETYTELRERGVRLVFLKEPYINTETYDNAVQIPLTGENTDCILRGINEYFRVLAREQIKIAFEQAEKEVEDLHQRTREGIETARLNGKQIGQKAGAKLTTKKSIAAKEMIVKCSADFGGKNTDAETMKLTGLSRNTFYKYKREIKAEREAAAAAEFIRILSEMY